MKRSARNLAVVLAASVLWATVSATQAARATTRPGTRPTTRPTTRPKLVTITIYHTGDIHEHTGSLARIAAYVRSARKKDPNVLLVDAGDMVGGYGEKAMAVTRGEGIIAMLTAAGYDACILGNWDYILGKQRIVELASKYPKFPLLACNVRWGPDEKKLAERIPSHKLFKLKGVTVAVVGSASHDMRYARGKRFAALYQPTMILRWMPALRKQADVVIALTHQYEKDDYTLAKHANAPDFVIGGHSHGAYFGWGRGKARAWIAKPGPYARNLGMVKITWDGKHIVKREGKLIKTGKDWPEDPAVKALRDKFMAGFKAKRPRKKPGAKSPHQTGKRPAPSQ